MGYLIVFALGFASGALSVVAWAIRVETAKDEAERKEGDAE